MGDGRRRWGADYRLVIREHQTLRHIKEPGRRLECCGIAGDLAEILELQVLRGVHTGVVLETGRSGQWR